MSTSTSLTWIAAVRGRSTVMWPTPNGTGHERPPLRKNIRRPASDSTANGTSHGRLSLPRSPTADSSGATARMSFHAKVPALRHNAAVA
jgi:hypothetical protein